MAFVSRKSIAIAALVILLILILLPIVQDKVWVGHIPLTVIIEYPPDISPSSIFIIECWKRQDLAALLEVDDDISVPCGIADQISDNTWRANLPISGREGGFGRVTSYHEPEFIIVQYRIDSGLARKSFRIPPGRGERSMQVVLP